MQRGSLLRLTLVVMALAIGSLSACASGDDGMEPPPPDLQAAAIVKASGDNQSGTVGADLADPIVVQVNDQFGDPFSGATVGFAVAQGGGSVATASATTGNDGRASTAWTLGTGAGGQEVAVTVGGTQLSGVFAATAAADAPAELTEVSGNNQTGPRNAALQQPVLVKVEDQFGNGVPGVSVMFVVTSGGGTVDPESPDTDENGEASTTWTLGDPEGEQSIEAQISAVPEAVEFLATAVNFFVTAVTDPLIEGASATLTGEGFDDATPANNVVTVDGVAATVTAATPTEITFTVPDFNCLPTRDVDVTVALGGLATNALTTTWEPAEFVSLAVGEMLLITNPNEFCLQFAPDAAGGDAYVVGVGSAVEQPGTEIPVTITATAGAAAPAPPMLAPPVSRTGALLPSISQELLEARRNHLLSEQRLRAFERDLFSRAQPLQHLEARGAALPPPNVGDMLTLRVPDADGDPCDFTEITGEVRVVGNSGVFVTDVNNPTTDELTLAELQAASDTFDIHIFDVDTTYFGVPSDLDDNDRVLVILTIEVNKLQGGIAGFVFGGDLFDRAQCASSDMGEIFYGHVPDPGNVAGTGARSKAGILAQMPSLVAHEFSHVIQTSRRLIVNPGTPLTSWEAEGQAVLAEEVVGHSILGNLPGQELGADDVFMGQGVDWYQFNFVRLALYYGWDGTPDGQNAGAPERCTLFGNQTVNTQTVCEPFFFYGASWSFQRYLSDRFGPGHPDGEAGFHRDWIDANPSVIGKENVEMLVGQDIDSLFAQWAAMHWADGRVAAAVADIQMTSWDLFDVFSAAVEGARLTPPERSFTSFTDARTLRGGSTGYTRLSAAGARTALAVRARGAADAVLSTGVLPQFWIVREQ